MRSGSFVAGSLLRWGVSGGYGSTDFKAGARFTQQMAVGLCIIHESFRFRVPAQGAAQTHRDIAQVAGGHTAVLALDVRDRMLPRGRQSKKLPM